MKIVIVLPEEVAENCKGSERMCVNYIFNLKVPYN